MPASGFAEAAGARAAARDGTAGIAGEVRIEGAVNDAGSPAATSGIRSSNPEAASSASRSPSTSSFWAEAAAAGRWGIGGFLAVLAAGDASGAVAGTHGLALPEISIA